MTRAAYLWRALITTLPVPWLGRRDFCVRGSVCETGDDSVTGFQSRRGSYDSFFSRNLYDCEAAVQSGSWAQRLKLRCSLFQTVMLLRQILM